MRNFWGRNLCPQRLAGRKNRFNITGISSSCRYVAGDRDEALSPLRQLDVRSKDSQDEEIAIVEIGPVHRGDHGKLEHQGPRTGIMLRPKERRLGGVRSHVHQDIHSTGITPRSIQAISSAHNRTTDIVAAPAAHEGGGLGVYETEGCWFESSHPRSGEGLHLPVAKCSGVPPHAYPGLTDSGHQPGNSARRRNSRDTSARRDWRLHQPERVRSCL